MTEHPKLAVLVQGLMDGLLDLVYPPHCVACGSVGAWLCASCCETIPWISYPFCQRCGNPTDQAGLCAICRERGSFLECARALAPHQGVLREAVHGLKYDGLRVLATELGVLLARGWRRYGLQADLIVPVPLHSARQRQRGYNQSALLARALGHEVGVTTEIALLLRVRDTPSQVGLTGAGRWLNVAGAFECQGSVSGADVLVVDDVYTTGATLQSCAAALLQAGAKSVSALSVTRALDPVAMRQQAEILQRVNRPLS